MSGSNCCARSTKKPLSVSMQTTLPVFAAEMADIIERFDLPVPAAPNPVVIIPFSSLILQIYS